MTVHALKDSAPRALLKSFEREADGFTAAMWIGVDKNGDLVSNNCGVTRYQVLWMLEQARIEVMGERGDR